MTTQAIREFINRTLPAVNGLAGLAALLEARAGRADIDPALAGQIEALLDALGARGVLDGISPDEATALLHEVRHVVMFSPKLMFAETRMQVWGYDDERFLLEAGEFARVHARGISANLVPALDGLAERFAGPDAAFLDIGVGVGGLAVELARLRPGLRIVGIDVWGPSLRLARRRVEEADLTGRVEIREQAAEQLDDRDAFDLAWVPVPFMSGRAIEGAVERTLTALRAGGWVVLPMANFDALDEPLRSSWRLQVRAWGGPQWSTEHVESLLRNQGYVEVRTLPSPPGSPVGIVAGRRAPAR